jgi:hypothetical protein
VESRAGCSAYGAAKQERLLGLPGYWRQMTEKSMRIPAAKIAIQQLISEFISR